MVIRLNNSMQQIENSLLLTFDKILTLEINEDNTITKISTDINNNR